MGNSPSKTLQPGSSVLVHQTAFWGDLLLCIPLLKRLKSTYKCHVTLLCLKEFSDFFIQQGLVDEVISVTKVDGKKKWKEVDRIVQERSKLGHPWTTFIFCSRSFRTYFQSLRWHRWFPSAQFVGFSSLTSRWVLDRSEPYLQNQPDALRQLSLIRSYDPQLDSDLKFSWQWVENRRSQIKSRLQIRRSDLNAVGLPDIFSMSVLSGPKSLSAKENQILVAPGSQWATKRWTPQGFAQVVRWILEKGYEVRFIGGAADQVLCQSILSAAITDISSIFHSKVKNLAGQTTPTELFELMKKSRGLLTNDSAPMHLASCAELPVVAIFGPTTLNLGYEPWQEDAKIIEDVDLFCRPCGLHGHHKCPRGTHECMSNINWKTVAETVGSQFGLQFSGSLGDIST